MGIDQLIQEILRLPRETRALLVEKLLKSLDSREDFYISPAWRQEIRRRRDELESGAVKPVPADEVFKKLAERFGCAPSAFGFWNNRDDATCDDL
ncbi:MAG TPA: addiction module protein [Verrucomicrobiae bacterium]|nr:addiction module protein [Verrucomicrobiae bacterium]